MRSWIRDPRRASMPRSGMRAASVLVVLVGALALAGSGGVAAADNGGPGTAFGYGSSWTYTSSTPASGHVVPPELRRQ
jgi:hypothetical protein